MAKQLLAVFDENLHVIERAVKAYRADGGKGHLSAVESMKKNEAMIGGDAQAIMEVIGHVSCHGYSGLREVFAPGTRT